VPRPPPPSRSPATARRHHWRRRRLPVVPYRGIQRSDLWWSVRVAAPRSTSAGRWCLALPPRWRLGVGLRSAVTAPSPEPDPGRLQGHRAPSRSAASGAIAKTPVLTGPGIFSRLLGGCSLLLGRSYVATARPHSRTIPSSMERERLESARRPPRPLPRRSCGGRMWRTVAEPCDSACGWDSDFRHGLWTRRRRSAKGCRMLR
jgi:hypothetical protein